MRGLATPPPVDLGLTPTDLLGKVPLFAALDGRQSAAIERCLRGRLALPDEVIAAVGER